MIEEKQNVMMQQEEEESFNFQDFANILLANWYWIMGCVAIALCVAYVTLLRTTPTYTRSSSLLIKEEKKGKSAIGSISDEFQSLGFLQSNVNINNEIITLSAPMLMQEVVKRLHLDVELSTRESLHQVPLYDNSPIRLLMPRANDGDRASFKMRLNANHTAELYDFKWRGVNDKEIQENDKHIVVPMNALAKTPVGIVIIQPTDKWKSNFTNDEISVVKHTVKSMAAHFSNNLQVDLNTKESTVLNITIADASKQRADDVIFKLYDVYNEQWLKDKNRIAESTFDFITNRLDLLSKELGDVDQKISDYRSATLLPDDKSTSTMFLQDRSRNNNQLLTLNNQLSVARYIYDYISNHANANQYLPTNTGIGSTGIETMIADYNKNLSARNEVLDNSSESTPLVQKLDHDLAMQRNTIVHSLDNLINQLTSQVKNWEAAEAQTNEEIATAPRKAKQLLTIGRQQKVKEALYLFLLQKREENELSKAFTAWNTRVVQPPMGSDNPSSPKKSMVMLIALALGIGVPVGLLLLRENMDNTVRGRKDLENMNTTLIGEIPAVRQSTFKRTSNNNLDRVVLVEANNRDPINEAFRIVRTKLEYYTKSLEGDNKVMMLTSFNPNSGKTFIVMNLAKVLSLKNKKVIALDFDFRKASLSKLVHSPQEGLSAYMGGFNDDYHTYIVKDGIGENADLLPVGVIPPNPAEILQSSRLDALMDQLRQEYDVILIDCPPIDVVADANIIAKHVDITLFVVRAGLMDRHALKDVDNLRDEGTYKHMALLLNGTRYVSSRYGNYRYGYSYGYGYGYGYYHRGGGKGSVSKR